MRRVFRRAGIAALVLVCAGAAALGFGMSAKDAARVRAFADAVRGWQTNPDYRVVSAEYVTLGVEAMQARLCGISAGHVVMGFRSIPGLPDHLAIGETSAAHYAAFSRGELSAYLHLTSEQGLADGLAIVERLAVQAAPSDAEIAAFLAGFKLPVPTVTDSGAVAGVRRLLADVGAKPFTVRADLTAPLGSHVTREPQSLTRTEQATAFAGLDHAIRASDFELWRSKQVSDFLAGIWAQGYGQIYLDGIKGFFAIQRVARTVFVLSLFASACLLAHGQLRHTSVGPSAVAPRPVPSPAPQSAAGQS